MSNPTRGPLFTDKQFEQLIRLLTLVVVLIFSTMLLLYGLVLCWMFLAYGQVSIIGQIVNTVLAAAGGIGLDRLWRMLSKRPNGESNGASAHTSSDTHRS
jgi:hypothetical protein